MIDQTWLWIGFNVLVLAMLALDLGVFHKKCHIATFKESITWTAVWVVLAMLFIAHTAYKIDTVASLVVIVVILATSIIASLVKPKSSLPPANPHALDEPPAGT